MVPRRSNLRMTFTSLTACGIYLRKRTGGTRGKPLGGYGVVLYVFVFLYSACNGVYTPTVKGGPSPVKIMRRGQKRALRLPAQRLIASGYRNLLRTRPR
eukprot:1392247-Amorphochlora_amoeboformis.AAC.1